MNEMTRLDGEVRRVWDGPYGISVDGNIVSVELGVKFIPRFTDVGGGSEAERRRAVAEAEKAAGLVKRWVDASLAPEDSWVGKEGGMGFVSDLFLGAPVKNLSYRRRDWEMKHKGEVGMVASRMEAMAERVAVNTADKAYKYKRKQADLLLADIAFGLENMDKAFDRSGKTDWGYAGSVGHVVEELSELNRFVASGS